MESVEDGLGSNLRRIREVRRMTQAALADAAGTSRNYVASLEGGRITSPSCASLYALAQALGVTMEALMGRPSLAMTDVLRSPPTYTMVHAQRELVARLPIVDSRPFEPMTPAQMEAYVPGIDAADLLEAARLSAGDYLEASMNVPAEWAAISFYAAGALAMFLALENSRKK